MYKIKESYSSFKLVTSFPNSENLRICSGLFVKLSGAVNELAILKKHLNFACFEYYSYDFGLKFYNGREFVVIEIEEIFVI